MLKADQQPNIIEQVEILKTVTTIWNSRLATHCVLYDLCYGLDQEFEDMIQRAVLLPDERLYVSVILPRDLGTVGIVIPKTHWRWKEATSTNTC